MLPARFDVTPLPALLSDMVTVDLRGRTPQQFASMIAAKLTILGITGMATVVKVLWSEQRSQADGASRLVIIAPSKQPIRFTFLRRDAGGGAHPAAAGLPAEC